MERINKKKIEYFIKKKGFDELKELYEIIHKKPFYDKQGNRTKEFLDFVLYIATKEEDAEYTFMTGETVFDENGNKRTEYLIFKAEKAHLLYNNK